MRAHRLENALKTLSAAVTEAQEALEEAKSEPDPLATHIYVSARARPGLRGLPYYCCRYGVFRAERPTRQPGILSHWEGFPETW